MSGEYFYRRSADTGVRKAPGAWPGPVERRGLPDSGRIVKLRLGSGHGFIRLANDREIYFHRADVLDGHSINDMRVGDVVTFERLDDSVSGARALGVSRRRQR